MSLGIKKLLIVVIIAQLCFPTQVPAAVPSRTIGILRMGSLLSLTEEKAYQLVEKKVERWLENRGVQSPRVRTLASSYTVEQVKLEADKARLLREAQRLWELSNAGLMDQAKSSYLETRALRLSSEKYPRFGPAIQKALIAEAAYLVADGQQKRADPILKSAVALHPDLLVEGYADWQDSPLASSILEAHKQKRICTLDLSIHPHDAEVTINGFEVGSRRVFSLAGGADFNVSAEGKGYHGYTRVFRCNAQHSRKLIVRLDADKTQWTQRQVALDQISSRHQVSSLFLISPMADEFRLFLYTPGVAIDRIPTSQPIKVAEVLGDPVDGHIPIVSDAFRVLLRKHESAESIFLPDVLPESHVSLPTTDSSVHETVAVQTDSKWYNNWTTWAIFAGVLGGVIFAVTRTNASVDTMQPQKASGIQIQF